jgi:hypothetical protein
LLAESATGADNDNKISAIDAEIAKAEQSDQAENGTKTAAASKARDTIEGLREMLETHNLEITRKSGH